MSSGRPTNASRPAAAWRWSRHAERELPQRRRPGGLLAFGAGRDDVHVDVARRAHDAVDHRALQERAPTRAPARSHDELGGPLGAGEVDERERRVGPDDLVIGTAEVFQEHTVSFEHARRRSGETFAGAHVHAEQIALGARGDARRPAHQMFATRRARQRDHHPFPRLPRGRDAVIFHVALETRRRPCRRPRAARARATPRGCRAGSSSPARRRPSPACRCSRAPCAAATLQACCRRARPDRPAARPRRATSPVAALR